MYKTRREFLFYLWFLGMLTYIFFHFIPEAVAGERSHYFSASGMAVFMQDHTLGTRDTGYPRPNQHYGNPASDPKNGFIIPSMAKQLNGKNRVLEGNIGFGATWAVGKRIGRGLRAEIELGYRQGSFEDLDILKQEEMYFFTRSNSAKITKADKEYFNQPLDIVGGGYSTRSLLANLFYDIPLTESFSPYVGAGIGAHWTTLSDGAFDVGASGFAYQLMAGLNYKATERLEIFGGYRYFSGDAVPIHDQLTAEIDTHSIEAGVRYYLDSPKKKVKNQRPSEPLDNPFYVGISGGLVQQQTMGVYTNNITWFNGITVGNYEMQAGYGIEAVVGYRVCSWCRVELEYSYKFSKVASRYERNAPGQDYYDLEPEKGHSSGKISNRAIFHALLVNFYADLNIANIKEKYGVLPFVGVGLGGMYMNIEVPRKDANGYPSLAMLKSAFAVQMAAGIGYSLTDQITVGTQWKYLTPFGNDEHFADINRGVAQDVIRKNRSYRVNNIGINSYSLFARYGF